MSKQDQIEECKESIEIIKNNLTVAEAHLKRLKEVPEDIVFDKTIFRVDGVGIGIYLNEERIEYLAWSFNGNEVKRLRDFLNEKIKFEESY